MTSQVYITGQPDRSKIPSLLKTDPTTALKHLIVLASQGHGVSDVINLVIQTVFNSKSKELLKLFYFYITLIPKMHNNQILAEVLLLTNQIRNDIQSINEYTRGMAMQCVSSFLHLEEIVDNFYKPIRENLKHKHSYVRRWAANALTEFYLRYPEKYSDIPDFMYHTLLEERDPFAMRQMVVEVHRMGGPLIMPVVTSVSEIPLGVIVDLCEDLDYVLECIEKVPFQAGMKVVKNINRFGNKKNILDQVVPLLLTCEQKNEAMCELISYDEDLFKGYLNYFLGIIENNDSLLSYPGLIEYLFSISTSNDFDSLCEFVLNVLRTNEGSIKVLLIEKLRTLLDDYGLKKSEIVDEIKECVNHEDPAIAYESLNFLSNQKDVLEIIQLEKIRYGKIFRKALNIIKDKIYTEEQVLIKILVFETGLENKKVHTERVPLLQNLYAENSPYIGASVALFFNFIVKNVELTKNTRARVIALLIKYVKMGEGAEKIDKSTALTISICLKDIYNAKRTEPEGRDEREKIVMKNGSVLDSILFTNLKVKPNTGPSLMVQEGEIKNKKQLTGITDPLLVIATVTVLQFEVIIDLYMRNQTNSLLQNLSLDLTTSQNLTYFSAIPTLPNLSASASHEATIRFKILECINSFVCGTITFNFPGDRGQYSGSIYTLNLSELTLNISNFLTTPEQYNFRDNWTKLEWENTYTVKLANAFPIQKLVKCLKGKIVNEQSLDFTVCNILCATRMGDVVLVNVMMYENENFYMECRIRGKSENVVKSISGIISDCVKENKQ